MKREVAKVPGRPQEPRGGYLGMVRDLESIVLWDRRYVPLQGMEKCLDSRDTRDTRAGSQDITKQVKS